VATTLLGKKIGMTRVFDDAGNVLPVTVLEVGPCTVLALRTSDRDGYRAAQIGFMDKRPSRTKKPEVGHAAKANTSPKRFVREVPIEDENFEPGQTLTVELFDNVRAVDVTGASKGRGFQGVMKRHGAHGSPASHGAHKIHRKVGSIGASATPSRVLPGKKMPGRMGGRRVTTMNMQVVRVDKDNNLLLVKGAVAGPNSGFVVVRTARKAGKNGSS